jgi:MFS family permease
VSTLYGSIRAPLERLWSDDRGPILVAAAAGWFLSMGSRMIYPILLPQIRAAYNLDLTLAGILLTVLFVLYGIGQFPGGILTDRFGERLILTISTVISAVTLFLVVSAGSVAVLFTATALFGLGLSLYAVARYTLLANIYPNQLGAANGVASAASDSGQSLLPPIAGLIAGVAAWELGFGFVIPLFLAVAAVLWIVVPRRSGPPRESTSLDPAEVLKPLLVLRHRPQVVYGTLLLIIGVSVWQAFTGFYPTYLIEIKDLSPTVASVAFGIFFALGIVIQPLSGGAYDKYGLRWSLTVLMSLFVGGIAVLLVVETVWLVLAVTVILSSLLGFATVTQSHLLVVLPNDNQGAGFGLLRTISFTIGAASPAVFGVVADLGFFDHGFVVLALLAIMMIGIAQRF